MIFNNIPKEKYNKEEKIDSEEFSKELNKLSKMEQEKIFYMIKGAALVSENRFESQDTGFNQNQRINIWRK